MKLIIFFVFIASLSTSQGLIRITDPEELAKDYIEAQANLYPRKFQVTAPLVVADPFDVCSDIRNDVKGKIVIIDEGFYTQKYFFIAKGGPCATQAKTRRIAESGGVGAIMTGTRGPLGVYYYYGGKPDPSVLLPALSTAKLDFDPVIDYVKSGGIVNATIEDTEKNPWISYGRSAAGILFQIWFEGLAVTTFFVGSYKLVCFIKYKGLKFHVAPISLTLEIIAASLRITMMTRPLSFYGFGFNSLAEAFLLGYSNNLSFMTDLLITFYWQEILTKCDVLSNKVLNNLSKFRIPFVVACIIIWTFDTLGNLSRGHVLEKFGDAVIFTSIIYVIFAGIIAAFFLYTGIKILKVLDVNSGTRKTKVVSRLMKIVVVTGGLLILQVVAIILYVSPANQVNAPTSLFLFWLWWTGLFGVSLSKVLMFETANGRNSAGSTPSKDKNKQVTSPTSIDMELKVSDTNVSQEESVDIEISV